MMRATHGRVLWGVLVAAASCGPATTSVSPAEPGDVPVVGAGGELHAAPTGPGSARRFQALGPVRLIWPSVYYFAAGRQLPVEERASFMAQPRAQGGTSLQAKGDVRDVYRKVAPATVIIRTPGSMGTGVIVSPQGWIITNHHVIADGETEGFRTRVHVELGALKDGVMQRSGAPLAAYVHKIDRENDLAVIKLVSPPANLPFVSLAKADPTPGEPVASLGHASIGLLWAIKDGEVASVGKLSSDLAELVLLPCIEDRSREDPRACAQRELQLQALTKGMEKRQPGLVVQSTCGTWHGDSGGPLVNRAGEIVALNAFGRVKSDPGGGSAMGSFHVHVAEIRKLMTQVPARPAQLLPPYWLDGEVDVDLRDTDASGEPDTLWIHGADSEALLIDANEDSFAGRDIPLVEELYFGRDFKPEVVLLAARGQLFAWYDTDADGRMDTLLHDERSEGVASSTYRILPGGELEPAAAHQRARLLRPALLRDRRAAARLGKVAIASVPEHTEGSTADAGGIVADPFLGGGRGGAIEDGDGDGRVDLVTVESGFGTAYVFDLDGDSLGAVKSFEDARAILRGGQADVELSLVYHQNQVWAFYDRDGDRRFDTLLHAPRAAVGAATEAFTLAADGTRAPAPDLLGRKLVEPALLGAAAAKARAVLGTRFLPYLVAPGDAAADSLPAYATDEPTERVEFSDVKGWEKALAIRELDSGVVIHVDLDRDTARKHRKANLADLVKAGTFDAELVFLHRAGAEWFFYDTDGDGAMDLVLFASQPGAGTAAAAYRIGEDRSLTPDPTALGKNLRASLFTRKPLQKAFRQIIPEHFKASTIGD